MPNFRRHAPRSRLLARGLAAVAGVAALTATNQAHALPVVQLAANVRWLYFASLEGEDSELSSAGLGLSAGVTLPLSFYVGAAFQYFVGTDHSYSYVDPAGNAVSREEFSNSSSQLLAHFGYDIGLLALTLRPSVGLGWWRSAYRGKCGGLCDPNFNSDGFSFSPGAEVLYSFGLLNVSGEARFDAVAFSHGGSTANTFFGLGAGVSL
jgi:hypothetical protein